MFPGFCRFILFKGEDPKVNIIHLFGHGVVIQTVTITACTDDLSDFFLQEGQPPLSIKSPAIDRTITILHLRHS